MKRYIYKGIIIQSAISKKFGTLYYSAINPRDKFTRGIKKGDKLHAHSSTKGGIEAIVDCYSYIRSNGHAPHYKPSIKNQALRLMGDYILVK